jgi:SAM-dependent methyltransferase
MTLLHIPVGLNLAVIRTFRRSPSYRNPMKLIHWTLHTCLFFSMLLMVNGQTDPRDQEFWNKKFSDPKTEFKREASPLLVDAIRGRRPGRALDLGMGEGRNTIYLAEQGWEATGVDISDVAIAQARTRAAKLQIRITAVVDDLTHYQLGSGQWDLIAAFYVHAWYTGTRPATPARLIAALKPGGLLVIEGFAGKEPFMFQPNELLRDFPSLRVLRYEDTEAEAEWAPGHPSHIIRFIAEKGR